MSKALKCNICMKCFDPLTVKGDFTHIMNYVIKDSASYKDHKARYFEEDIDLCPDCTAVFKELMSGKRLVDKSFLDAMEDEQRMDDSEEEEYDEAGSFVSNLIKIIFGVNDKKENE